MQSTTESFIFFLAHIKKKCGYENKKLLEGNRSNTYKDEVNLLVNVHTEFCSKVLNNERASAKYKICLDSNMELEWL